MIADIGIDNLLPDFKGDLDDAVDLYRSFGTTRGSYRDLEKEHGAVALDVEPLEPEDSDEDNISPGPYGFTPWTPRSRASTIY